MSDKEKRRDFESLGGQDGDNLHRMQLHLEADVALRLEAFEAWTSPGHVTDVLADAIREKLADVERVRESRGGWRIDQETGQLIEEE